MPYTYYRGNYYYVPSEQATTKPKRVYDNEMRQLLRDKRKIERALADPANNGAIITVLERLQLVNSTKISKCEDNQLAILNEKKFKYE